MNAELIKALKACANNCSCDKCPYGEQQECPSTESMMNDAADALEAAEKRIAELEAQIPKEGEWIDIDGTMFAECSVCGKRHYGCTTPYCDMCGARMRGEHDGET